MSKTTLPPPHQDKGIKTSVVFHKTLLSVAIASAFMLNFPISHAESLIEEISSSQKFNEDIKFTSNSSIKLPPLSEREEPVVIDASGHKITFDSSQIQIGNNQNLEIKADDVLFTGTLAGGETNGAITIRTNSDTPAQLSFTSKVRFEDASGVVHSTQGQGGTKIFFNQGSEINNMQFGSASRKIFRLEH